MDPQIKGVVLGAIGSAATLLTLGFMFKSRGREEKKNHGVAK